MEGEVLVGNMLLVILCVLSDPRGALGNSDNLAERYRILNETFRNYDGRIPPVLQTGQPVVNLVQLYVLSIDSVNDFDMDFKMNFYLRQSWKDPRLHFTSDNISRLELDASSISKLWLPDSYFINEKTAELHEVTMPNKLLHISRDGTVLYSLRVSGKFSAFIQLHKFPLDSQEFRIEMTSYGYSNETLLFRWRDPPVILSPHIEVAQFDLKSTTVYTCDSTYLVDVNFTCIGLKLFLERLYGYYVIQIYIPSILIVFVSWVSFWLAEDATPARVSLGILTVLTMTSQFSGTRASLARVSYVKGIDIWMAVCLAFVFLAIIEFAFVNLVSRTSLTYTPVCGNTKDAEAATDVTPNKTIETNGDAKDQQKRRKAEVKMMRHSKAVRIDRISRIVFPCCFFLFNLIYWSVYAS